MKKENAIGIGSRVRHQTDYNHMLNSNTALGKRLRLHATEVNTVTFQVLTSFGERLPYHVVALAEKDRADMSSHCSGSVCHGMPFGVYGCTLQSDTMRRQIIRKASLFRSSELITVDAGSSASDAGDRNGADVLGSLPSAPSSDEKLWARFQGVFSGDILDATIAANGQFRFERVPTGKWILMIFRGGDLLCSQQVKQGGTPNGEPMVLPANRLTKNRSGESNANRACFGSRMGVGSKNAHVRGGAPITVPFGGNTRPR